MEFSPPAPEREPGYRIPEIAELEGDTKRLVEKLKAKIDENYYTLLVSDEIGGRIPTLVLRKVISMRHPGEPLHTSFVNGGNLLKEMTYGEGALGVGPLSDHLALSSGVGHRVLVVTQIIDSGNSIGLLVKAVREAGCEDVDVASVRSIWSSGDGFRGKDSEILKTTDVYVGADSHSSTHAFDAAAPKLSGVAKPVEVKDGREWPSDKPYTPHPRPYLEVVAESGRAQFETAASRRAALGLVRGESHDAYLAKVREKEPAWREALVRPVDDEERAEAAKAVADARADVALMAERIVREVWGEGSAA